MKTILALFTALSLGTAFAQSSGEPMLNIEPRGTKAEMGQRHMVEFTADSLPTLIYSMTKTKTKGTSSDNDSSSQLSLNYAYAIHPNIQVGGKLNYFNGLFANNDVEQLDVQAGLWLNSKAGDLKNSPYINFLIGTGYAQTFGANGGRDDIFLGTIAFGKRYSLERFGVNHVSWTPEIAFTSQNSTANSSYDYRQATEFRLLQFSVLW
jgi:hypothetical protein